MTRSRSVFTSADGVLSTVSRPRHGANGKSNSTMPKSTSRPPTMRTHHARDRCTTEIHRTKTPLRAPIH